MADEPRTDASTTREAKPYQILDDQDEDRSEDEVDPYAHMTEARIIHYSMIFIILSLEY
jgi:hypothetical protein